MPLVKNEYVCNAGDPCVLFALKQNFGLFWSCVFVSCRVSAIKRFSTDMMNSLRRMIIAGPHHFLLLSRTKQLLLVDKMAQRLVSRA